MTLTDVFESLPEWLRNSLLDNYRQMIENYVQERWEASSLNAGKFCEAMYHILKGYPPDTYPAHESHLRNFPGLCKQLEPDKDSSVSESIRILIPRALPAIYRIRNNRNVGHISSKLDANQMDASFAVATCSWALAELVRVFVSAKQTFSMEEAQVLVEDLTTAPVLVVWKSGDTHRVLDTTLNLPDQIVLLAASGNDTKEKIRKATEHYTDKYLTQALERLHVDRAIEFSAETGAVKLTPKGLNIASRLAAAYLNKSG
jgi:hypothetical protein